MKTKSLRKPEIRVRSLALAIAACFATANSMALPVGPQVVNGVATVSQVGNTLNVTNSNGAILNWQSFSIGANEVTRFIQPSASSAVLNRVLAQDPSVILGSLTSNGKVWLVNPAGILVGPGARIDTAAFVASTLNITNADFLANRMRFEAGNGQVGNIVNQGSITTPLGGSVYLVGVNVSNDGLITTPKGETILAAGNTVELIDSATPGVKVEITGGTGNATNLGEIVAQAGRIGIAGVIVRNSGALNASSVVQDGGKIFLRASKDAYVDGAGRIVTTGKTGGQVEVLGERVAVMDQASIDASGEGGGGKVLIGGDWQGMNPDLRNAQVTYVGPDAEIKVNATKVGAGGTAVVWADDTTRAYGRIEAKGVTRGGQVETSGKRYLDVDGARVEVGENGTWLLDPADIRIVNASFDSTTDYTYGSGIFSYGGALGTIRDWQISNALGYGGNVTITTSMGSGGNGDIVIYGGTSLNTNTGSSAATLSLHADRNIELQYGASVIGTLSAPLSVAMEAYGGIALAGVIKTYGGDVALKARDGVAVGHAYYASLGSSGIINARVDGAAANEATSYTGTAGRILINADTDSNGGIFKMYGGSLITTTSKAHLVDSTGSIGAYGSLAFGVVASDIDINTTEYGGAYIRLNQYTGSGAQYGGGDIGFAPSTNGLVALGSYGGVFSLDNAELARILMPRAGATNCGTGQEGCRIWIGNPGIPADSNFTVPATTSNFVVNQADFTSNDGSLTPKRVHLTTSGIIDDAGVGTYGGYYGAKAGHLTVSAGNGIGTLDSDGLSFFADSVNLMSSNSTIKATSVGGSDLALRRATAYGAIDINVLSGGVTLLPYFAGQKETTYGSFSLSASGNIRMAADGTSYTVSGPLSTFTETPPSAAAIRAGGNINLHSSGGSVAIAGDHAAATGMSIFGYAGISITDGGLASDGVLGLTTYGDLTLTGVNRGVFVMSSGAMSFSADNVYATGGSGINPGGKTVFADVSGRQQDIGGYGAGITVAAYGDQAINVTGGVIQLQAGSANNANYAGPNDYDTGRYGGSVVFKSNANQTILAQQLRAYGGVTGHDNLVMIGAYGDQTITLGSYGGSASALYLKGGDAIGSYNNLVNIEQQGPTGNQSITLYGAGASLTLQAGNGTGTLGRTDSECASISGGCSSGSSNNSVQIQSRGNSMEIDLYQGGAVSLTGGNGGYRNHASIEFNSNSSYGLWIGSDGNQNSQPSISLNGGTGGMYYGTNPNDAWLSNGAEITAGNDYGGVTAAGVLSIDASSVSLTGGAGALAPAIISATKTNIVVYGGDLTLTGGTGTASSAPVMATGAVIGNDTATSATITTYGAGSDVRMLGGSGAYGAVMIGSLYGAADVAINSAGAVAAQGNTGGIFVGSMTSAAGSDVRLIAGSGSNVDFDAAARIGATTLTAAGAGISMRGLNVVTGQVGLTSYGSGAAGNIEFNLGSGSLGAVSTMTDLASSQIIKFSGNALSLAGNIDMEGDSLQLYATSGNIIFGSGGSLSKVKDVLLNAYGGIYNNNTSLTIPNIDVSTYGGTLTLNGAEIGVPAANLSQTGSPVTVKPGTGGVYATATSGGINLLQTTGSLATSQYTISSPSGNHIHLQSAYGISYDSSLAVTNNPLLLIAQDGAITQSVPITTTSLYTRATGGIVLEHASNNVGRFSAYNSMIGDIRFNNSAALTIENLFGSSYGVFNASAAGLVTLTAGGTLTISPSSSYGIRANGSVSLTTTGATSDIIFNSGTSTAGASSVTGNVRLQAGQDIHLGYGGHYSDVYAGINYGTNSGSGSVEIIAGRDISLDNNSYVTTYNGDLTLAAGRHVSLKNGMPWIGATGAGDVSVTAANGYIKDVGTGTRINSSTGLTTLAASTGIDLLGGSYYGSGIAKLAASTSTGDISIKNWASPLTINSISNAGTGSILVDNYGGIVVDGSISGGGPITLNAHSPITVNAGASISGGGLVTLAALSSGTYSTTDLLSIAGSVSSTGGNIALSGGSGVSLGALSSLNVASGKSISASSTYGAVRVDPDATISGSFNSLPSTTTTTTPTVTQEATATITTATETAANSLSSTTTDTPPPPPATTGSTTSASGGLLLPSAGETIGGTEGNFGSSSTNTPTATSSTQPTDSSGPSSSSSSSSSSNGQQESSQESKPSQKAEEKKAEKKEEKKDEKKKTAEEKSEGKKDEKAASKKVSQCT